MQLNKPVKHSDLTTLIAQQLGIPVKPKHSLKIENQKARILPDAAWVFIIDDDNSIREAIRQTFEGKLYNVSDFSSAETFLKSDYINKADCILIDAYLPQIDGIELLELLKKMKITIPTIMITGNADISMSVKAMKAGAMDFLEKPIKPNDLISSVELALTYSKDKDKLFEWQADAANLIKGLTPRQIEVMNGVMAGKASQLIAYELGISQRTVENHRALIMRKTNTKSIPSLARLVIAASQNPLKE